MTRRTLLQLPGAAAAAPFAQTSRTAAAAARQAPPNILFLMVDQMTPFLTPMYSRQAATMPNLQRLASEGVVFENAYCNSPLCVPSRMSMFSGRLAGAIDGWDNASVFHADIPSFVHYLRSAGYETTVSGKAHYIGPDQYHGFHARLTPDIYPTWYDFLHPWVKGPYWIEGTSIQAELAHLGPSEVNTQIDYDSTAYEHGLEYLRRYAMRGKGRPPFFLNVSFTQPHDPYCAPAKYLDMYRNAEIPMPHPYDDIRKLSPTYEWVEIVHGIDREKVPPAKVRETRRNYMAMCTWVDDRIGGVLAELRRLGLADNTFIVFTSDHGDMQGEKGQWFKRIYLEWSARVPMVLNWAGRLRPGRNASLVSLVDLFPTFVEAAGGKVETAIDGKSLLPLADGREDGREREVIGQYCGEGLIEPECMVRRGQYKYIAVNNYAPQLYDLKADPYETVNFAGRPEYAAVEKQLRERSQVGWDGPSVKRRVMANQADREFERNIKGYMNDNLWKA